MRLTSKRLDRWRYLYAMPVMALLLLLVAVFQFPAAFRAHEGQGVLGTFTVTQVSCIRDCQYSGRFVSDDGHVIMNPVDISNLQSYSFGESVRALDDGGQIYPAGGGSDWLLFGGMFIVSVAVLAMWGRVVFSPSRRRSWFAADDPIGPDGT